ncbi:hypothetical protein GYM70_06855 [Lactobacillus panisapium]|uniref:hypothetical protein n=1 Tax=Lactobacillus TaxID=1578 RepID=UPI000CDBA2E4|nr:MULTISPECIES: hypothetical protein [Lactobacillus]MCX8724528.1 hypothetical protein [Lactobacillus sp. B4007]QYN55083.1 hypothetical protein GYM70_06855 [Lactobacillus panisapium]
MNHKNKIEMIEDDYFNSSNWKLKAKQTAIALVGWFGVILPFFFLALPLWFTQARQALPFNYYYQIIIPLKFLARFFNSYFVFIALLYFGLTEWNNYRFSSTWTRRVAINTNRCNVRKELIENAWTDKFGNLQKRQQNSFYTVKKQQNLEPYFAQLLFVKGDDHQCT